ncbi:MAG TPA: matrixin family metalloprotease [Polyangiales bacterium]
MPWRSSIALLALVASACSSDPRASAQPYAAPPALPPAPAAPSPHPPLLFRRSVQLTIFGSFPEPALAQVEAQLRSQLDVEVLPARQRELPASAYYAPRKRYRAERLLDALDSQPHRGFGQLGLTEVDISTTKGKHKDWGVFGLAWIGGDSAVLSTHRLLRDKPSEELYRFRVVTTAVHEIGHMLGLDHCSEPRCLMNDAEGSIKTVDESSGELGPRCKAALTRLAPKRQLPLREREGAAH